MPKREKSQALVRLIAIGAVLSVAEIANSNASLGSDVATFIGDRQRTATYNELDAIRRDQHTNGRFQTTLSTMLSDPANLADAERLAQPHMKAIDQLFADVRRYKPNIDALLNVRAAS